MEASVRLIRDSLIPYTYRTIRRAMRSHRDLPVVRAEQQPLLTAERLVDFERQYGSAVRQFIGSARAWGIEPILMTQVRLQGAGLRGPLEEDGPLAIERLRRRGFNERTFRDAHDRFNDVLRRLAKDEGVLLIDLARARQWSPRDVYDELHFTDAGSTAVAEVVAEALGDWLKNCVPPN
ncbi:MAG: hypothetical protein EXQ85_09845 [Alphaproteobacteria bacterium]|nr:hypothetical protein [Alphaproteobacteria bacterium]